DDPAERDNWPGELHHVSVEGDKIADGHFSEKDLSSAEPQHDDNGGAQHEFERGPEHSHQADQAEAAADVFLISALEGGNLCLFLHIGADDAGARKVFLGAGRNVREHGLNAFEALVNAAAEILDDDAGDGQGQKGVEGELGADGHHEAESAAGEDQVVAQIELDIARDSDDHPARQKLEDSLDQSDGDDEQRVGEKLLTGHARVKIVDGAAENLRKEDPDSVIE